MRPWMWILLVLIALTTSLRADAVPTYQYAYFDDIEPGFANLYLINPHSPDDDPTVLRVQITPGFRIIEAFPSPDGEAIAIISEDQYFFQMLSIYRMKEQASEEVVYYLKGIPVWSADGQYLVANTKLSGEAGPSNTVRTYVYSLTTKTRTSIYESVSGRSSLTQENLSLSPINQLVIGITSCQNNFCKVQFDLIEGWYQTPDNIKSAQVEGLLIYADLMCPGNWSPDGRYLSFILACDSFTSRYYGEVYIWDLETNSIIKLTNNTNVQDINGTEPLLEHMVRYDTFWTDPATMLLSEIAAPYSLRPNGGSGVEYSDFQMSTSIYIDANKLSEIDARSKYEFTENPISGELAYRIESFTSDADGYLIYDEIHVEIATYNEQNFDVQLVAPYGCHLKWSPDGSFLAYISSSDPYLPNVPCRRYITGLYFINREDNQVSSHPLSTQNRPVIVGWVGN